MPQLIISIEDDYPKVFDIEKDETSIGRHSENDIQLPFNFISSFHAQLKREPGGEYRLTDADSHNGTTVNGNNLGSALLEDGDQISFGGIRAAFRVGARRIEEPKTPAPGARTSASGPQAPPMQETASIAVRGPGATQSLSEVELQARLRDKLQEEIAKEFANEKKRIDDLKRISAALEADTAEARAKLEAVKNAADESERAAAGHQSDFAMREHLVRDLERARKTEQQKLDAAQAAKEEFEREKLILQHELTVGGKELERIKKQIAEGKEAAEKADAAFKKVIEHETRSVELDTEIVAKEKTGARLDQALDEKQARLVKVEKDLDEKRRELEEIGGVRLVELKGQIEQFEKSVEEKKAALKSLGAEKATSEKEIGELKTRLEETGGKLKEARLATEEQQRKFDERRARADVLLREIEEHSSRNKGLTDERKGIEDALRKAREEHKKLDAAIGEKKKAAEQSEEESRKIEEFRARRKRLEVDLGAKKEQLAAIDTDLASKRRTLEDAEKSLERGRAELDDITSVRLVKLRAEAEDLQKEAGIGRKKRADLEKEITDLEKTREERLSQLEEKAKTLRKLEEDCKKRAADLAEIESKKDRLRKERETAGSELEEAKGELQLTRVQLDDQKKIARKISDELRTLEERKTENEKLEAAVAEKEARLKELEAEVAGRRNSLRQVEKELISRQKSLRKYVKKSRFSFGAALGGDRTNGSNESLPDDTAKKEGNEEAAATPSPAETKAEVEAAAKAQAKREALEKENRELSALIAEKTATLQKLEEKIGHERAGDREKSDATKDPGKSGEKDVEFDRGTGNFRKLSSSLKNLKPDIARDRVPGKGGIELLNTDLEAAPPDDDTEPGNAAGPRTDTQAKLETPEDGAPAEEKKTGEKGEDKEAADTKVESKSDSGNEAKGEPKAEAKAETDSGPKIEAKGEVASNDDPEAKADAESESESESKSSDKTPGKSDSEADLASKPNAGAEARNRIDPPVVPPLSTDTPPGKPDPVPVPVPRPPKTRSRNGHHDDSSGESANTADEGKTDIVPLRIIHPRTREMTQSYPDGAAGFDPQRHPPVGFHALAACTGGSVHRTAESLPSGDFVALILLGGSLDKDREIIRHVSRQVKDKPLLACWREGRLDKLAAQLEGGSDFQYFTEMLSAVDGLISTDARTSKLLGELQVARRCVEIPLPYPIDAASWDYSIPLQERNKGIFVSGDGFDPGSEEHKARIDLVNTLAEKHRLKVTVYHHLPDILADLNVPADLLSEPNKTLFYDEFLSLIAQHRFVVGFGKNLAGGEVWGDTLLTRNVYLGGHGELESLLFPDTSFSDNKSGKICEHVGRLLDDSQAFEESVAETRRRALRRLSFTAARTRLGEFLGKISQELLTIS